MIWQVWRILSAWKMIELSVSLTDLGTILRLSHYFSYSVVSLSLHFSFRFFPSVFTECKLGSKDKHWHRNNLFLLNKGALFSGENRSTNANRKCVVRRTLTNVFLNMEPSVSSSLLIIVLRGVQYPQSG